ncbi:flagellar protein FlgN [Paenibacillus sp. UMB4589-SE434]|uniref:flagellar protein FlgN n=1 Tax=Paenibacillus sp. UMB4589-SE434 TaxID=3046314 RepID=UPI0025512465|nr:flagellar protein FlgN [Paenibacillus sp. UMB4589-SE434]MDK8181628.1 flagellar protein FlgN [Paenibacillus sp. UMB4589-SE434]
MSITRVIAALDQLSGLHKQLLEIAEEKKGVLIRNEVDVLAALTNKESRLIKLVNEADEERNQAAQLFLKEKGIRSSLQLTVTELSKLVFNHEERAELHDAQLRLTKVLEALKVQNRNIQDLLEQSLNFVDYSLNLLTSRPEDESIYQHPSLGHNKSSRSMFDTRA